jgi:hypothetical protein
MSSKLMIVHYDRTPYKAVGRHGSRVQRANGKRLRDWRRAQEMARKWPQLAAPVWLELIHHLPPWMLDPTTSDGSHSAYYDIKGKRIGIIQASLLTGDIGARRIGLDQIGEYEVSTVHLTDAALHTNDGRPLIFETMAFHAGEPEQRWLTTTKERAQRQHAQVCNMVLRGELNN